MRLPPLARFDLVLLAVLLSCWLAFFAVALDGYRVGGLLDVDLYQLYALAALVGWILGNLFVQRSRRWSKSIRRKLLALFLFSPGGLFYLLWALGTEANRTGAPFAPLYAFLVSMILFLVPVSFRGSFPGRSRRR